MIQEFDSNKSTNEIQLLISKLFSIPPEHDSDDITVSVDKLINLLAATHIYY